LKQIEIGCFVITIEMSYKVSQESA